MRVYCVVGLWWCVGGSAAGFLSGTQRLLDKAMSSPFKARNGRLYAGVEPSEPVAFSSRQMAAVRALESERHDRLFYDPLSSILAGDEAMAQARCISNSTKPSQGVGRKIAVRTRFFDDFMLDCYDQGIRGFVILGAGMDTRAWRLFMPQATLAEVDVHAVMRAKNSILQMHAVATEKEGDSGGKVGVEVVSLCVKRRVCVSCDVARGEWVDRVLEAGIGARADIHAHTHTARGHSDVRTHDATDIGADVEQQTHAHAQKCADECDRCVCVLMEGLLMYLDAQEVESLLASVGSIAPVGSRVGISAVDTRSLADGQASSSPLRQSWKWGLDLNVAKEYVSNALSNRGTVTTATSDGRNHTRLQAGHTEDGGGGDGAQWRVDHVVVVGTRGAYPRGANYGCWPDTSRWKRRGKTLYIIATRVR